MLNEMLHINYGCPVCGRYDYYIPREGWGCPYCGPSFSTLNARKVDEILKRLAIIEESLPIESIPLINIDKLFDKDD